MPVTVTIINVCANNFHLLVHNRKLAVFNIIGHLYKVFLLSKRVYYTNRIKARNRKHLLIFYATVSQRKVTVLVNEYLISKMGFSNTNVVLSDIINYI